MNTMLRLINIKRNGIMLEADYVPEQSDQTAHVVFDTIKDDGNGGTVEPYGFRYLSMALSGLERIASEIKSGKISEPPHERLVMWY